MKIVYFTNRWIHIDSLLKAVIRRYKLANLEVSKATLSRHIGKLEPDIDRVALYHVMSVYRMSEEEVVKFLFFLLVVHAIDIVVSSAGVAGGCGWTEANM